MTSFKNSFIIRLCGNIVVWNYGHFHLEIDKEATRQQKSYLNFLVMKQNQSPEVFLRKSKNNNQTCIFFWKVVLLNVIWNIKYLTIFAFACNAKRFRIASLDFLLLNFSRISVNSEQNNKLQTVDLLIHFIYLLL